MKTKLLIMALGIAAIFSSCQKEDSELSNAPDSKATFSIEVNDGVETRAITPPATPPTRYIMEVYEVATADAAVSGTPQQRYEEATGSFTVILKEGVTYACLFWADYGSTNDGATNEYAAADLKKVSIVGQATKMAFGGLVRFTYDSKAATKPYLTPTLTHSVAQVNYKQTEDFMADGNSLTVELPKTYSINLDGNVATEIQSESASVKATHSFTSIAKASKDQTIGTSYIIATDATQTVMDITATFNSEVVKNIANVPFQRNYKTNIKGAYSNLYETTLSVTCDDAWETPDNNEVFPKPVAVGDYYYSDNTFSAAYDNTKTAIGIVFWVDPADATKGKIVSLDEGRGEWGPQDINEHEAGVDGIRSDADGKTATKNLITLRKDEVDFATNYYAFNFAYEKNDSDVNGPWYLPAKDELMKLYSWWDTNQPANNLIITTAGGTMLASDFYKSATESYTGTNMCVNFSYGISSTNSKTSNDRVRLVRDIE